MPMRPDSSASFVADLHIHSRYAFACSKSLSLDTLSDWAKRKGIDVLTTGDFTHPLWAEELRSDLRAEQNGLYSYGRMNFVPGTEISCVYKQGGRTRRIHMLVMMPTLDAASDLTVRLGDHGKLANDGRPTVSLSARDLLEMALECHHDAIVIPAHAWTPWYGVYGSKGGFDSLKECFGDLAPMVAAVESGLSSDPGMNRMVAELDGRSVVSFSDAHSPARLGREMTALTGELSWDGLLESLRNFGVDFTVEFYPEEGKYHYSGHRKCGVIYGPEDEAKYGTSCPVCGRPLTLGVLHRITEVSHGPVDTTTTVGADGWIRSEGRHPPYARLVPLQEIVAAAMNVGVNARRVAREYNRLTDHFGSELAVLLYASEGDLLPVSGETLTQSILDARAGNVLVDPGYDGVYGSIKLTRADNGKT